MKYNKEVGRKFPVILERARSFCRLKDSNFLKERDNWNMAILVKSHFNFFCQNNRSNNDQWKDE